MGSSNAMLSKMIQDAILSLCTQNMTFNKSLEIDGIICVSPSDESNQVVIKMHRTIVKPPTIAASENARWRHNATFPSPYLLPEQTDLYAQNSYQLHSDPKNESLNYPPSSANIRQRSEEKTADLTPLFSSAQPPVILPPTATEDIPGDRLDTQLVIKDEPQELSSSPKPVKRTHEDDMPDEPKPCSSKQPRIDPGPTNSTRPGGQEQSEYNINIKEEKEEPVMIELDDEDEEGVYDAGSDGGTSSWFGDSSITLDINTDSSQQAAVAANILWEQHKYREGAMVTSVNIPLNKGPTKDEPAGGGVQDTTKDKGKDPGRPTCELCLKSFATKRNLQWHTYTHTGEKPFQCDRCPEAFPNPGTLLWHKRRLHNVHSGRKLPCTFGEFEDNFDKEFKQ